MHAKKLLDDRHELNGPISGPTHTKIHCDDPNALEGQPSASTD
jgi:hypothetical protein